MKIVIVSLFASLLMSHALSAQQQSKDTPPPQYIQTSGATVTFQNAPGSGTITLEYLFTTGISAPTITVQGCGAGGTCTTLTAITGTNPYTTATNAMVTFAGGYFQYKVTATYTGTGTITVSFVGIQAKAGSQGGGGPTTFDQVGSGTNTSHGLVVGAGSVLTTAGNGVINANELNGVLLSGLATGPLCNTTSTGVPVSCDPPSLANASLSLAGTCTAMYLMTDTTGTTTPDACGNGNNATNGSSGPTKSGTYYTFASGQTLQYPTTLNNFTTMQMVVQVPPFLVGTTPGPQNEILLGTNSATQYTGYTVNASTSALGSFGGNNFGIQLFAYGIGGTSRYQQTSTGFNFGNNADTRNGNMIFTNWIVLSLRCEVTNGGTYFIGDQKTLDGTLYAGNLNYGCANALQAAGNYQLGASTDPTYAGNGFLGRVAFVRFSSTLLTDDQIKANARILQNAMQQSRGIPFNTINHQAYLGYPQGVFIGDSVTCGANLSGCAGGSGADPGLGTASSLAYPSKLVGLTNTYQITNYGAAGAASMNGLVNLPWFVAPLLNNNATGKPFAYISLGSNNIPLGAANAQGTWSSLEGIVRAIKSIAPGARIVMETLTSRTGTGDANKNAIAVFQRANYKQAGVDALVDVATDLLVGQDGTYANPNPTGCTVAACFQGDGIHPTAQGQVQKGLIASCGINWIDGSSPSNPNPTPITAATYTTTCSDGGLQFNAVSNSIVATLNSARWQTNREIKLCNVTSSGVNTVTLTAPSDFPFNNVTGSTTIVLTAGSCSNLIATFNGITGSGVGVYWRTM